MSNDSNTTQRDEPHFVTVTARYAPDGTESTPDVKFECRAEAGTGCRVYPACDCESWDIVHGEDYGEGHEPVPHDECWLQGWFDNDGYVYEGDDYDDMGDYQLPRGMNRAGRIEVNCHDDYISWEFAKPETVATHVGRAWTGHEIEDGCPCPQEPCGLVDIDRADPSCLHHPLARGKTIRQGHGATACTEATR